MNSASKRPGNTETTPQAKRWVEADGIHIDVRGLSPPGPLVAILELVESIHDATHVIVHHERDPADALSGARGTRLGRASASTRPPVRCV